MYGAWISTRAVAVCMVFVSTLNVVQAEAQFREPPRYLVVISDLHMGLGKVDGRWHPYEDFRWPKALKGFLNEVSRRGKDRVDLIIAGDFLELWQIPDDIACKGAGAGLGCSVDEVRRVTRRIIKAHSGEEDGTPRAFDALAAFSQRGENRLYLLPGNHDAALLVPEVWTLVADALQADSGRVRLVGACAEGRWTSVDGRIVVEHGQQMGADLNKFKRWPRVVDSDQGLLIRTEGELNVQKLFNDVERTYPVIDNLSPEVKGAWYRAQDRGVWGTLADFSKLIAFLLFETSIEHKGDILGEGPARDARGRIVWDLDYARQTLGYKLFALALAPDDPVRQALMAEPPPDGVEQIRADLARLAQTLGDADLKHLCDQLALRGDAKCWDPTAGAIKEALFSSRYRVKRDHLRERIKQHPDMEIFIYGHTHQLEEGHDIELNDVTYVTVFNSGAFQRVMDDESYRRRLAQAHPEMTAADGLSQLKLEGDFKPCYTAVLGRIENGRYKLDLKRWYMPEDEQGVFVVAGDSRCTW